MKVLVTGGAGYVGGALTDLLLKSSHDFRVYDLLLYEDSYRKDVDFIYGDVRDKEKLLPHLKWCDVVVWLAALVGDGACAISPKDSADINTKTIKWLSENFDGRIIFMSTCSVYGAQDKELDELSPTDPRSVYASTKLEAEKYLTNKDALIFRLGTLFGVGDKFSRIRLDLIVNTLTVRAFHDKRLKVFGGQQFRPLLHVKDASQAIVDNLNKHKGIFNLCKENIKIIDLAQKVASNFPNVKIDTQDMNFEDTRNYRVRTDKAKKILNFRPKYTIKRGVEEIKELLTSSRIKDFNNPRYTNQMFLTMFNNQIK